MNFILGISGYIVALVTGLWCYKSPVMTFRWLLIQTALALSVECIGYFHLTNYLTKTNVPLYNIYLLFDFVFPLLIAYLFCHRKDLLKQVLLLTGTYIIVWIFSIWYINIDTFFSFLYILDSFILLLTYCYLLYQESLHFKKAIIQSPIFWLCVGTILFYGVNLPFFSLLPFLSKNLTTLQFRKLHNLLLLLIQIRYFAIAYSFYLVHKNTRS